MHLSFRQFIIGFMLMLSATLAFAVDTRASADSRQFSLFILDSQRGNPYDEVRAALLKSLKKSGYVEGKNLTTTLRVSGNDILEGERILREAAKTHYDVILVGGTSATTSARNVLLGDMSKKVVFAAPTDPIGIGVIQDFSQKPASNFTGVCYPVPLKARLKFFRQLMPEAKTLGLIYADMPQSQSYNRWLQELIATDPEFMQMKIIFRPVALVTGENGDKEMAEAAVRHIRELDAQVDAFIKPCDQMGTRRLFSEAVYKNASKPLLGLVKDDVMEQWGAMAVVYPSHSSIGEQAATMVKALFEGGKVSEIKPEWPRQYGFAVDLRKIRQFGLKAPVEVLQLSGDNIVK